MAGIEPATDGLRNHVSIFPTATQTCIIALLNIAIMTLSRIGSNCSEKARLGKSGVAICCTDRAVKSKRILPEFGLKINHDPLALGHILLIRALIVKTAPQINLASHKNGANCASNAAENAASLT